MRSTAGGKLMLRRPEVDVHGGSVQGLRLRVSQDAPSA